MNKIMKRVLAFVLVLAMAFTFVGPMQGEKVKAANSRAIVIIPGILGSSLEETTTGKEVWLHFFNYGKMALTEYGTSVYSVDSVNYDNYGANDTYKTLYKTLNKAYGSSMDVIFFDYDFRMDNREAAAKLERELSGYSRVILVAHSMGGLVASRFLNNNSANREKTELLITLGTPYVGAAKCENVMETGEMLDVAGITIFKNTIKDLSKNSVGAYELLPTDKYYKYTGYYPLKVGNTYYSTTHMNQLRNTAWGKRSNGIVKSQFSTAESFHSSLFNSNGTHVTDWAGITTYRLVGTGLDTISRVNLDTSYNVSSVTTSNNGDGTVIYGSAMLTGGGYSYTNVSHTDLVKNSTVLNRVKTIITNKTGVKAKNSTPIKRETLADIRKGLKVQEFEDGQLPVNKYGWIECEGDERITVYASENAVLLYNGVKAKEEGNLVLDSKGRMLGSVWTIGQTGRKMYSLYDGAFKLKNTKTAQIEYMDAGKILSVDKYTKLNANKTTISISKFNKKTTKAVSTGKSIKVKKQKLSKKEINKLNSEREIK